MTYHDVMEVYKRPMYGVLYDYDAVYDGRIIVKELQYKLT